jgi:PHD-finger
MVVGATGHLDDHHQDASILASESMAAASESGAPALSHEQEPVQLYCLCRTTDETDMIGCDKCDEWYHFNCVGIDVVSDTLITSHSL